MFQQNSRLQVSFNFMLEDEIGWGLDWKFKIVPSNNEMEKLIDKIISD